MSNRKRKKQQQPVIIHKCVLQHDGIAVIVWLQVNIFLYSESKISYAVYNIDFTLL
jgi:hypothetical protein